MGLMDKLKEADWEKLDWTEKRLWKSVGIVNYDGMDEPNVLQQRISYPTTSTKTQTTAPLEEHRLIPISELVED